MCNNLFIRVCFSFLFLIRNGCNASFFLFFLCSRVNHSINKLQIFQMLFLPQILIVFSYKDVVIPSVPQKDM